MLRIISILFCGLFTCIGGTHSAYAQRTGDPEKDAQMADRRVKRTGNVLKIAADAPDRYTVKRGDTLWDISSRYLTDPWRWPELWRGNKEQIKDPHWIYPGDLLVLDRTTGTLSVERGETHSKVNAPLRLSPTEHIEVEEKAIPLIAANVMGPFLSRPLVLDARVVDGKIEESEVLRNAPKIIGGADGRVILGTGDRAYVSGLKSEDLYWNIFRSGRNLIDPDNGETLGIEAIFLGTVQVARRGEPSEVIIKSVKQEILQGDRLVVSERKPILNYLLKKPDNEIKARVMSVYGGVNVGGQYSIISINKGKREGLAEGNVLALFQSARPIQQKNAAGAVELIQLPDDRYGLVTVFRVTERVSYALVMDSNRPLQVGDSLRNP